jgi:hypothetical protein
MSLAVRIAPSILDTILGHLALLFLSGARGDISAARQAASQMLAAYDADTADEVSLAAEVISFGFHALEALSEAAAPDLPITKILRLRGSAVSLSREGHKAQRKLDQLQRARRAVAAPVERPTPIPQPDTAATGPQIDEAMGLIAFAREAIEATARNGGKNWTQSYQQREAAKRITANLKRNQMKHASQTSPQSAATEASAALTV